MLLPKDHFLQHVYILLVLKAIMKWHKLQNHRLPKNYTAMQKTAQSGNEFTNL